MITDGNGFSTTKIALHLRDVFCATEKNEESLIEHFIAKYIMGWKTMTLSNFKCLG